MACQWTVTLLVSLLALFGFTCAAGKHTGCKSIAWFVEYYVGLPCGNMCEWMYCYVLDSIVQLQNTKSNIFQVGLGGTYLNYGRGCAFMSCRRIPIDPLPHWVWLCCHELWHHILMTSCRPQEMALWIASLYSARVVSWLLNTTMSNI